MSFLDSIVARASRPSVVRAMVDLHPEILDRVHVLSARSDEISPNTGQSFTYQNALAHHDAHVWVRKAVKVITENFAAVPVRVMRADKKVTGHPLAALLTNVNGVMTSAELWGAWCVDMLLGGETGWELVKGGGGQYVELWPRQPHTIAIVPDVARLRYFGVVAYRITDNMAKPYDLPPDEFVFFKFYNPRFPWRGLSPVSAVRNAIALDTFAQAWSIMFFRKSARPDYAIITPQGVTPTEREELEKMLSAKFGGVENSHKPVVLEQGVTDIKVLDFRPKDMEWLSQRAVSREEIGGIFGVPDEIMGWGKDTYENFQTALRVLWTLTIMPLCAFRDTTLTEYFRNVRMLRDDEQLQSDFSNVAALADDEKQEWELANGQIERGAITINEWREREGLAKVAWGDVWWAPATVTPVTDATMPAPAQLNVPTDTPSSEDMPMPPKALAAVAFAARQLISRADALNALIEAAKEYGGEAHRALIERAGKRTAPFERRWRGDMADWFERERVMVIEQLRKASRAIGKGVDDVADDPFDVDEETQATGEAFRDLLKDVVSAGGIDAIESVGGDNFLVNDPRVRAFLKAREQRFAQPVTETTWKALKASLNEGMDAGESLTQLEARVTDVMQGRIRSSAETIARTEVIGAYNGGTLEGWRQSDVVESKVWIAELDDRVRPEHEAAHGQEVGLDEPFIVGGVETDAPGETGVAELDINCRCAMIARVK